MGPLTDLLTTFAHTWWAAAQAPGTWQGLWTVFTRTWLFEATFYFAAALLMWALLHGLLRRRLAHRLINGWPSSRDLRREVTYSISTLAVFAALGLLMWGLAMTGHIEVYANPAKHGPLWLWASLPALILWHDTWFYWTHRWMHRPAVFRRIHAIHHASRPPTAWAAMNFHPLEAAIVGLFIPALVFVVPIQAGVLATVLVIMTVMGVTNHMGWEMFPKGLVHSRAGRWLITASHHERHHEQYRCNYGLYFRIWDHLCRTDRGVSNP